MDKAIRRPPKPPSRSEHLLIVDDEKDTADVMKMALERAGFSVDVFYHPTIALQEFIAGKYDLVLIDVKMPVMDGFALFDHMRVRDPDLEVCFMTARSDSDEVFRRHLQDNRECLSQESLCACATWCFFSVPSWTQRKQADKRRFG